MYIFNKLTVIKGITGYCGWRELLIQDSGTSKAGKSLALLDFGLDYFTLV